MAYDGTLKFDTSLNADGVKSGVSTMDKIISGGAKMAVAGVAAIGAAFVGIGVEALKLGGNLEQSLGGIETMFKNSSGKVVDNAKNAFMTAGLSANAYMEQVTSFSASLLQGLGGDTEKAADIAHMAMVDMADNANKFGTDISMIQSAYQGFAKDNYTMLDNLKLGYGGTAGEMARLVNESGVLNGEFEATAKNVKDIPFDTLILAIHTVQEEMGVTGTTSKEAMETLNGSITATKAAWENFLTGVGSSDVLVDTVSNTADLILNRLGEIVPRLAKTVPEALKGIADKAGKIFPSLKPALDGFTSLINTGIKVVTAVLPPLASATGTLLSVATKLLPVLIAVGVAVKAWEFGGILTKAIQGFQQAALQVTLYTASVSGAVTADALQTAGLTAKEVIVGVLTGKIGLATAAQWVWNTAMSANPIGLVIAGIALLVGAIVGLNAVIQNANSEFNEQKEKVESLRDSQQELNKTIEDSKQAYADNTANIKTEMQVVQNLSDEIYDLAGKTNKTTAEKARLKALVEQLNKVMPDLNLQYDEQSDSLSKTKEATDALITSKRKELEMQALQERYMEVAKQRLEAEQQLEESGAAMEAQQERVNDELRMYNALGGDVGKFLFQFVAGGAAVNDTLQQERNLLSQLTEDYDRTKASIADLTKTQDSLADQMGNNYETTATASEVSSTRAQQALIAQEESIRAFAAQHHLSYDEIRADMDENSISFSEWQGENKKALDKAQKSIADFADKWGFSVDDVDAAITRSGLSVEKYVERQDEALEHARDVLTEYTNAVTDGFSTMEQNTAISLDKFMENMQKNEEATANWANNLNTLMDLGINQGVIEQLATMGPEGALQAQAFVDELTKMNGGVDLALGATSDTVDAKLAEIDATFQTSLETASAAADTQLRAESYYAAGYASIDKIASGISENPAAVDAATQSGTEIGKSISAAVDTVDFSQTGQTIGSGIATGLTSAIQSNAGNVTGAVTNMGTAIQGSLRNTSTQAVSTVTQMMTDSNSAIVTRASTVKASITDVGNGIVTALDTAKTQAGNTTTQMMTDISSTIITRTDSVKSAIIALANIMLENLRTVVPGTEKITTDMMNGILEAMRRKEQELFNKAREIADRIAMTMASALEVRSPSRVMIRLFEFVMMGIYVAMDGMSGMLYREADTISEELAERLAISPDTLQGLVRQMRTVTEINPLGGNTLVQRETFTGTGGGWSYTTKLTQNITTPKPLSPSEMTREGQDLLRRSRWQLP